MVTSSEAVQVPLATIHLNMVSPCCKLLTFVLARLGFWMVAVDVVVQ